MQGVHPEVERIIAQFEATELHAARSGREVTRAFGSIVADTTATTVDNLEAELGRNLNALLDAMPAYAPPVNAIHQVFARLERTRQSGRTVSQFQEETAEAVRAYQTWSEQARLAIAVNGSNLIQKGSAVFTFTLSETVLGTLRTAHKLGIHFKVLLTESRPNYDGLDTARALAEDGVEVGLSIDGGIEELIPQADIVLVGAEAILSDGSAICKVGTYPCALAAQRAGVPLYILVDTRKLHATTLFGVQPYLDPIPAEDVLSEGNGTSARVAGHLFDRTPAELIAAIVSDIGILHPSQVLQQMLEMPISESIAARLADRQ